MYVRCFFPLSQTLPGADFAQPDHTPQAPLQSSLCAGLNPGGDGGAGGATCRCRRVSALTAAADAALPIREI